MFFMHSHQDIEKNRQFYKTIYDSHHPLIQLERLIDWQWITQKAISYYAPTITGRPSLLNQNHCDSKVRRIPFCPFYM